MIAEEDEGVLDPRTKAIFDQMPGCWGCKDKDSVFMYANFMRISIGQVVNT